jgi:acetoacetyl-CoA synthetase
VNGKKIEIAVKKIVSGTPFIPSVTVANPGSLENYYIYQDIEKFAQLPRKANGSAKL